MNLEFHPFAEIFPLLEGAAFDELVADIRTHGMREPVITYQGKILDGRNRARAAEVLGLEPPTVEYTGDAPLHYVVSLNLHRRHLSESQRAMVAETIATRVTGRPVGGTVALSVEQAAQTMNVSEASVERARKVRRKGAPELAAAVERGEIRLGAAEVIATASLGEQSEAVAGGAPAVRALVRKKRKSKQATRPHSSSPEESRTRDVRATPPRRALYLCREFVSLRVAPADFIKVAGRPEAYTIAKALAKFAIDLGARARPKSSSSENGKAKPKAKAKKPPAVRAIGRRLERRLAMHQRRLNS